MTQKKVKAARGSEATNTLACHSSLDYRRLTGSLESKMLQTLQVLHQGLRLFLAYEIIFWSKKFLGPQPLLYHEDLHDTHRKLIYSEKYKNTSVCHLEKLF